jgi:hypothetical protein
MTAALVPLATASGAREPMDLQDPQPRQVEVRFEVSPSDRPGQTDAVYTAPFLATLEPGDRPGELRVRVDGRVVEEHLLPDHHPRRGSFSDFVWHFDAETGHVRSATVSGTVVRQLRFGPKTWEANTQLQIRMDTRSRGGFERAGRLFGEQVHRFCSHGSQRSCTLVEPRPYDPATGYVNAVGDIAARSGPVRVRSFSPLGEAIFSERPLRIDEGWQEELGTLPANAQISGARSN